jgi:hypothetical protein
MQKNSLLNDYLDSEDLQVRADEIRDELREDGIPETVKLAKPKISSYREKFRKKALSFSDLPIVRPAPFTKRLEDNLGGLLVGEGVEREF